MDDYLEDGYADAFNEFPALAVHEGTPDFERVLYLAMNLLDGDMPGEIEMDVEEAPWDEPDAWAENGCTEYGPMLGRDPGTWREDTHGGAAWVTFEDEDEAALLA
jgi:hypothetical protein